MSSFATFENWLCDMDGVFIRDGAMIPGADQFLKRLESTGKGFLILTNNSMFSPSQLRVRLSSLGLDVTEDQLWTSAMATAKFVHTQRPSGSAFVIGQASLHEALENVSYTITDDNPDYVILGETQIYSFEAITTAVQLIEKGSHFIATNPEPTGPSPQGSLPGCGAVAAMIERATNVAPYFVGKPNGLMLREGLDSLGAHSESTVMIGDRMETDILAGIEVGLETILVLSGVTLADEIEHFPYQPSRVVNSVADLIREL